eukprot:3713789-Prymnesium_polylepis.1
MSFDELMTGLGLNFVAREALATPLSRSPRSSTKHTGDHNMLIGLSLAAAAVLQSQPRGPLLLRSSFARAPHAVAIDTLPALEQTLPFVRDPALVAPDVEYRGFGVTLRGRAAYVEAANAWHVALPARLRSFEVSEKIVLPPDARSIVAARYRVGFEAPVPPQVLPAQRSRVARAELRLTPDGLVPVGAKVACTLVLDAEGRILRHTEALAVDPFAVDATIAHFEFAFARLRAIDYGGGLVGAYWGALRELTRQELDEVVRRSRSDELQVLEGDGGVTDEEFERWFVGFIAKNLVAGGAIGAALYFAGKGVANLL